MFGLQNSSHALLDRAIPLNCEIKQKDHFRLFCQRLKLFQMPVPRKGLIYTMNWTEHLSLTPSYSKHLSKRRKTLKTVSSTFALPKLFIQQIKLAKAYFQLHKVLIKGRDLQKTLGHVKQCFFLSLKSTTSFLKFPLLLDKTGVINLKAFQGLPDVLKTGASFLGLSLLSMQFTENAWTFGTHWKQKRSQGRSMKEIVYSGKGNKLASKLMSCSLKAGLKFWGAVSKFFNYPSTPLLTLSISTALFAIPLIRQMLRDGPPLFGNKEVQHISARLPLI